MLSELQVRILQVIDEYGLYETKDPVTGVSKFMSTNIVQRSSAVNKFLKRGYLELIEGENSSTYRLSRVGKLALNTALEAMDNAMVEG